MKKPPRKVAYTLAEPSPPSNSRGEAQGLSTGFRVATHNNVFSIPKPLSPTPPPNPYNPPGIIGAWRPPYTPHLAMYIGVWVAYAIPGGLHKPIQRIPSSFGIRFHPINNRYINVSGGIVKYLL